MEKSEPKLISRLFKLIVNKPVSRNVKSKHLSNILKTHNKKRINQLNTRIINNIIASGKKKSKIRKPSLKNKNKK